MAKMTVGGPMFEGSVSGPWRSVHQETGAHYNTYAIGRDEDAMAALRQFFPDAKASDLNFVLFSTSGVHGMYTTIEEAEKTFQRGNKDEDGEDDTPHVTFLIVQPRIVCLRYVNCYPASAEDFQFLKDLRASSWKAVEEIGRP